MELIIFYSFAALLVLFSLGVVLARNVFHSALALTVALSVIAGLFAMLGGDFLAASQLLIYVGGIMIIMLFVVMLSQRPLDALQPQMNAQWPWGILFAIAVGCALVRSFRGPFTAVFATHSAEPTSATLGRLLLGDMLVPFEAVSLVLLAALVGAVLFGQDPKEMKS